MTVGSAGPTFRLAQVQCRWQNVRARARRARVMLRKDSLSSAVANFATASLLALQHGVDGGDVAFLIPERHPVALLSRAVCFPRGLSDTVPARRALV